MSSARPIYLDYNSTTPIDPAVLKAMLPYLGDHYGNPSCTHLYGREAHTAVERAREQVAELLGANADEIVFTGGGSLRVFPQIARSRNCVSQNDL